MKINLITILIFAMLCMLLRGVQNLQSDTGMYQKGLLAGRNEAHKFIRCRVSPDAAQRYVQWIEKEGTK